MSSTPESRPWCVAGAREAVARLEPLITARRALGAVRVAESADDCIHDAGSILIVGGEQPPDALLEAPGGRCVPVGWLPDDSAGLERFGRVAAEVVSRQIRALPRGPFVLLAEREKRALRLADELESLAAPPAFRWTAERLVRRDLLPALGCGPGVAVYVGHALRQGWLGYGGVDAGALASSAAEPLGALLSVACDTAGRADGGRSFCAAALGATGKTLHRSNRALARAICALPGRTSTLADLLAEIPVEALAGYTVCGDPAAPLIGADGALEVARRVYAPAPGAILDLAAGWTA